jgi:hypothetical protein
MPYIYHEKLPDACPELDAHTVSNERFYRWVKRNPATSTDFLSKRMKQPNELFRDISECIACAVSLHKQSETNLNKLPGMKGKILAIITLTPKDGLVKQTFDNPHYSWWRSSEFTTENNIIYL